MKIYLVPSSLFFLVFFTQIVFANTLENEECLNKIMPRFGTVKYRASIDVLNKHLSGILIFKTVEEGNVRTVFMNEMGATFFDMTFKADHYIYNKVMESLDKKAVKKTLAKDIGMIVMRSIYKGVPSYETDMEKRLITFKLKSKGRVTYTTTWDCLPIEKIENFGRRKCVVQIKQFYSPHIQAPDSIFVQHNSVHFTISLKQFDAVE